MFIWHLVTSLPRENGYLLPSLMSFSLAVRLFKLWTPKKLEWPKESPARESKSEDLGSWRRALSVRGGTWSPDRMGETGAGMMVGRPLLSLYEDPALPV